MEDNEIIHDEEKSEICKIRGLDLILKSINCVKYKSKFEEYGINEQTMLYLTANDLRLMNVDNSDIHVILNAVNILNKTLDFKEVRLSNDEISKMQSNICGQLGSLVLILNHVYYSIVNDKNHQNDMLIDNYLSSVDAALMLKPYMKSEEKQVEKSLKEVFKVKNRKRTIMISTTLCAVFLFGLGLAFRRSKYVISIPPCSNLITQMKSWTMLIN